MIKETILSGIESGSRDWLSLALLGLGISFLPYAYIGGLFLALAGASIASHWGDQKDRTSLFMTMTTAFFVSHLTAIAVNAFFPAFPVQLAMAAAGLTSKYIVRTAFRFAGRVESKSETFADRAVNRVLPPDEEKK